jgi:hypothetical protein
MESCGMSDHKFESIKISAQGIVGISAAVLVVGMFIAVYR